MFFFSKCFFLGLAIHGDTSFFFFSKTFQVFRSKIYGALVKISPSIGGIRDFSFRFDDFFLLALFRCYNIKSKKKFHLS